MHISVAICTWNRCESLRQTLEQMTRLAVPASVSWELLAVNNNCTDRTDETLAEFQSRLPLKRLLQPQPGLSNARNTALAEARGEYLIWTDDDVLAEPDWLAAYARAFQEWPQAEIFGGPIEPLLEGTPPAWLTQVWPRLAQYYGRREFGPEAQPLSEQVIPFGANFALRTALQKAHPFDPRLGRRGELHLLGEEVELIRGLLRAGHAGRWVPQARLQHRIPPEAQTLDYLRRRSFGFGQTTVLTRHAGQFIGAGVRWRWRWRAARATAWYILTSRLAAPKVWMEDLLRASYYLGKLDGWRRRTRV